MAFSISINIKQLEMCPSFPSPNRPKFLKSEMYVVFVFVVVVVVVVVVGGGGGVVVVGVVVVVVGGGGDVVVGGGGSGGGGGGVLVLFLVFFIVLIPANISINYSAIANVFKHLLNLQDLVIKFQCWRSRIAAVRAYRIY